MEIIFDIIVPVYNAERYLVECIDSVLSQSYQSFNLVLIDDGSVDSSGAIIDEYSQKYHNVVALHQKNLGQIYARNAGIDYIRRHDNLNHYLVFLDSDDMFPKNSLEKIAEAIHISGGDLIFYDKVVMKSDGKIETKCLSGKLNVLDNKGDFYRKVLLCDRYNPMWAKSVAFRIVSNENYEDFKNIRLGEDLIHSLQFYKNCTKVAFIDAPLYIYRDTVGSITNDLSFEKFEDLSSVRECVYNFIMEQKVWDDGDYAVYFSHEYDNMMQMVKRIAILNASLSQKVYLYSNLGEATFYRKLLELSTSYSLTHFLLRKKHYRVLAIVLNVAKFIKQKFIN